MGDVPTITIIQLALSMVVTFGFPVVGWFIKKIFSELEISRSNERELYKQNAQLQIQICSDVCSARELILKELLGEARAKIKN